MVYVLQLATVLALLGTASGKSSHRLRHAGHVKVNSNDFADIKTYEEIQNLIPVESSSDGVEYRVIEHKDYDELKVVEECFTLACGVGKRCILGTNGEESCVCADPSSCGVGHKLVCGSDGNLYESHCQLHRTACKLGKKIYVDRGGEACFQKGVLENNIEESQEYEEHVLSKKKDLSQSAAPRKDVEVKKPVDEVIEQYDNNCSPAQFQEFKHLLKIYHCNRLGITNCDHQDDADRRLLMSRMYSYYDRDRDGYLTIQELLYSQTADHLEKLAHICSLRDILVYRPFPSGKDYLDRVAFYEEFGLSLAQRVDTTVSHDGKVKVTYMTADGYGGLELVCTLPGTADVAWMRNGRGLNFQQTNGLSLLTDRKLYITAVNLDYTGNYTCYESAQPENQETQVLVVQVKPVVRSNVVGLVMEGATAFLKCHVDGVPQPSAQWQISQYDLPEDEKRYNKLNGNSTLSILHPRAELDSGEYQCIAKSPVGWSVTKTDLQVLPKFEYVQDTGKPTKSLYMVFHGSGYTTFESQHCYTTHSVDKYASDFVRNLKDTANTLDRLCPHEEACEWGTAANIKNKLIYASQPGLNRIIIIDAVDNFRPKHVILMEHQVSSLHYLESTDELWILVGNQAPFQTVMILSDASDTDSLELKPLLPQHSVFDSVERLFIPAQTTFNITPRYAFTSHYDEHGLTRLDTVTLAYLGAVDLTRWACQPTNLHHLSIGGLALVSCSEQRNRTNLMIDTVTNEVIGTFEKGEVHVSPNGRHIVTVIKPNKLAVHYLNDNGTVSLLYRHTIQMSFGQLRFMESKDSVGYDLAITSPDENAVLFMDLRTTKTDVLEGLLSGRSDSIPSANVSRLVATGGEFEDHIMMPSRGALFIINKQYHMIACEWPDIVKHQYTLWLNV